MTKEYAAADGQTSAAAETKLCRHSFWFRAPILARMAANRKREGEKISPDWR